MNKKLSFIRQKISIGDYEPTYCEICGREIDVYESEETRQRYIYRAKVCDECEANN